MSENGLWFRCYTDIYRNKKLRRLRPDLQLLFLWCCALRKEMVLDWCDDGGIAFMLRLQPGKLRAGREALVSAGLLDENGQPVGWEERQFESDVSTPRVKRFRERFMKRPETVTETPSETDTDSETDSETEKSVASDDARRLADLLASLIRGRLPKARVPGALDRWAADIDKIARVNGHTWPEIERVMRWSQADSFWQSNILSGAKLRKQFDTLDAQSRRPATGRKDVTQGNLDALAEYNRRNGD